MSVVMYERAKSRDTVIDLRSGSTTVEYAAHVVPPYDASDYEDLMSAVSLTAPLRNGFQLRRGWEIKSQGGHFWLVTVHYGFDELDAVDPGAGDLLTGAFSFETAGGTQHITQSLGTVSAVSRDAGGADRSRTLPGVVVTGTGNATLTSASGNFTAADVGMAVVTVPVDAAGVGMLLASVTSSTVATLSANWAVSYPFGVTVSLVDPRFRQMIDVHTTSGSTTVTCAGANFTSGDVGRLFTVTDVSSSALLFPPGTTIVSVTNATTVVMSAPALATTTSANGAIGVKPANNYARAIGVTRDGVSGCDRISPKLEWQITRRFLGITIAYISLLRQMVGTMNNDAFYGHAAGECLLIGASGAPSQNNQSTSTPEALVTFKFASSPSLTAIDVSGDGTLVIPVKAGWDYLWCEYEDIVDATSRRRFSRPRAAYIERIYDPKDFSSLGIGVSP